MCGISAFAIAGLCPVQHAALLQHARTALKHRGPDSQGTREMGGWLLACDRLAIIHGSSEAHGSQPLVYDDNAGTRALDAAGKRLQLEATAVTFSASNEPVSNWQTRNVGSQDITVLAQPPATVLSMMEALMSRVTALEEAQAQDSTVVGTLVCNGEIYNYKDLVRESGIYARTDVDVVGHLLLAEIGNVAEGDESSSQSIVHVLDRLNGDFAGVFVAATTAAYSSSRVIAFRDCLGVRPLYYGEDKHGRVVAFASEAKALLSSSFSSVTRVFPFPPGHMYDSASASVVGGASFHRFSAVVDGSKADRNENRGILLAASLGVADTTQRLWAELRTRLRAAVARRLDHSDRPVALLLSGGLDSAILACLACDHVRSLGSDPSSTLHTFSARYSDGVSTDHVYATLLASSLGIPHTSVTFTKADALEALPDVVHTCESADPNTVRAAIPMYLLARHISRTTDYKVLISGEGSDELFMGYAYFGMAKDPEDAAEEATRLVRNLHMFDVLRADRSISRWGLEARVPFLDRHVVEFALRLPGHYRTFKSGVEKAFLRDAFRNEPCCAPLRDTRVIDRQKERFSDGCGLMYVPMLLRCAAPGGEDARNFSEAQAIESKYYRQLFCQLFPMSNQQDADAWVVKRELPAWATTASQGSLLS